MTSSNHRKKVRWKEEETVISFEYVSDCSDSDSKPDTADCKGKTGWRHFSNSNNLCDILGIFSNSMHDILGTFSNNINLRHLITMHMIYWKLFAIMIYWDI